MTAPTTLCYIDGCPSLARREGLCYKHGGYRVCEVGGCPKTAVTKGRCRAHGGGVRCEECGRPAQGSTKRCAKHGNRCVIPGCSNWEGRKGICSAHDPEQPICAAPLCSTPAHKGGVWCIGHNPDMPDSYPKGSPEYSEQRSALMRTRQLTVVLRVHEAGGSSCCEVDPLFVGYITPLAISGEVKIGVGVPDRPRRHAFDPAEPVYILTGARLAILQWEQAALRLEGFESRLSLLERKILTDGGHSEVRRATITGVALALAKDHNLTIER